MNQNKEFWDPAIQGLVITETSEIKGSKWMVIHYKPTENIEMKENRYKCIGILDENTKFNTNNFTLNLHVTSKKIWNWVWNKQMLIQKSITSYS